MLTGCGWLSQGRLSERRLALVQQAFAKLDKDGSGTVTVDDLRGVYNVTKHPEVRGGNSDGGHGVCGMLLLHWASVLTGVHVGGTCVCHHR